MNSPLSVWRWRVARWPAPVNPFIGRADLALTWLTEAGSDPHFMAELRALLMDTGATASSLPAGLNLLAEVSRLLASGELSLAPEFQPPSPAAEEIFFVQPDAEVSPAVFKKEPPPPPPRRKAPLSRLPPARCWRRRASSRPPNRERHSARNVNRINNMDAYTRAKIEEILWPPGGPARTPEHQVKVWAVLDGARDPRIFPALDLLDRDYCCLYAGKLHPRLARAAPYLVRLEKGDRFTDFLIREGWGRSWGTFLRTQRSYSELRKHLRTFLRVKDETGRKMIFRWYDPRVLRVYLPTCTAAELRTVFGPVERYIVERPDARGTLVYSLTTLPFFHLAAADRPFRPAAAPPAGTGWEQPGNGW